MKFEDIHRFFDNPPPDYLNKELAVCYILSVLLQGECYGTALIDKLTNEYHIYRISDTVLYGALKFLEREQSIVGYWQKVEGRGRPRRMYYIPETAERQARDLAGYWYRYVRQEFRAM